MSIQAVTPIGYMPNDTPPWRELGWLALQQVLTMFPATVLVAILTKFDVSTTLLACGVGTIVALFITGKKIPLYYGSSFSYLTVVIAAMSMYSQGCYADTATNYCPEGVKLVQVGIMGTGVVEILFGFLIMWIGKKALDKVLPPVITGSMAIVIGIALAGTALNMASKHWLVGIFTLVVTIMFSVYLQGKGIWGMLPIFLGACCSYLFSSLFGLVNWGSIAAAPVFQLPHVTLPAFNDPRAWSAFVGIAFVAIATIPESTAHLYQMSLYIDRLAVDLGREPTSIKNLVGLNLVADGFDDLVVGFMGGCAGTNYGENNSLMAITRNYSVPVLIAAGVIAGVLAFFGQLAAVINSIPTAVVGGLSIYLFGVIGMQGVALIQSEKVNLFDPKQLAVGSVILVTGIGGAMTLPNQMFPFSIPVVFPDGIPAIVFAAILGILVNALFLVIPPVWFGVVDREDINS